MSRSRQGSAARGAWWRERRRSALVTAALAAAALAVAPGAPRGGTLGAQGDATRTPAALRARAAVIDARRQAGADARTTAARREADSLRTVRFDATEVEGIVLEHPPALRTTARSILAKVAEARQRDPLGRVPLPLRFRLRPAPPAPGDRWLTRRLLLERLPATSATSGDAPALISRREPITEAADMILRRHFEDARARHLSSRLEAWLGGGFPMDTTGWYGWGEAYVAMRTTPFRAPRRCLDGAATGDCLMALQLAPAAPEGDPDMRVSIARPSLLLHVLTRPGVDLAPLADSSRSPAEVLAAAAGVPIATLLAEWHARVVAARPRPVTTDVATTLAALGWIGALFLLALRSSRWR